MTEKHMFSVQETAERWGVSPFTIRRLIDKGQIRSLTISARRMIPRAEIERCELMTSIGKPRKRKRDRQ